MLIQPNACGSWPGEIEALSLKNSKDIQDTAGMTFGEEVYCVGSITGQLSISSIVRSEPAVQGTTEKCSGELLGKKTIFIALYGLLAKLFKKF